MLIEIEHELSFRYDDFVSESFMELRVEPRSSAHQTVRGFRLAVGPPSAVSRYLDWNGNVVHHFGIRDYHGGIQVKSRTRVQTHPAHPALGDVGDTPSRVDSAGRLLDFARFGGPVIRSERLEALNGAVEAPASAPLGAQIEAIGRLFAERFTYRGGVTRYDSDTEHILAEGAGVCQDFAHLMLGVLRLRGVPCRYVSGYLHLERESEEPAQSHAWVEAWAPSLGWIAFDPTHDRVPDESYVSVARGRHYDDVPPNRGIYRGSAAEELSAAVRTRRAELLAGAHLGEEVEPIGLPVLEELPLDEVGLRPDTAEQPGALEDPQQQQQQQ